MTPTNSNGRLGLGGSDSSGCSSPRTPKFPDQRSLRSSEEISPPPTPQFFNQYPLGGGSNSSRAPEPFDQRSSEIRSPTTPQFFNQNGRPRLKLPDPSPFVDQDSTGVSSGVKSPRMPQYNEEVSQPSQSLRKIDDRDPGNSQELKSLEENKEKKQEQQLAIFRSSVEEYKCSTSIKCVSEVLVKQIYDAMLEMGCKTIDLSEFILFSTAIVGLNFEDVYYSPVIATFKAIKPEKKEYSNQSCVNSILSKCAKSDNNFNDTLAGLILSNIKDSHVQNSLLKIINAKLFINDKKKLNELGRMLSFANFKVPQVQIAIAEAIFTGKLKVDGEILMELVKRFTELNSIDIKAQNFIAAAVYGGKFTNSSGILTNLAESLGMMNFTSSVAQTLIADAIQAGCFYLSDHISVKSLLQSSISNWIIKEEKIADIFETALNSSIGAVTLHNTEYLFGSFKDFTNYKFPRLIGLIDTKNIAPNLKNCCGTFGVVVDKEAKPRWLIIYLAIDNKAEEFKRQMFDFIDDSTKMLNFLKLRVYDLKKEVMLIKPVDLKPQMDGFDSLPSWLKLEILKRELAESQIVII